MDEQIGRSGTGRVVLRKLPGMACQRIPALNLPAAKRARRKALAKGGRDFFR